MDRDSADARSTDNRVASNGGCFGCLPVTVFIGALIADLFLGAAIANLGCPPWLRAMPITAYVVVIGLLHYGYYRKNLPWGALFSGLQFLSIMRVFSMLGFTNMVVHLIRR